MSTSAKRQRQLEQSQDKPETSCRFNVLRGLLIHVLQAGIGKARTELFENKIVQLGGTVVHHADTSGELDKPTHMIVDDSMTADRLLRILKVTDTSVLGKVTIVRSAWISECIKNETLVPTGTYKIDFNPASENHSNSSQICSASDHVVGKPPERKRTAYFDEHEDDHGSDSDYHQSCSENDDVESNECQSSMGSKKLPVSMVKHYLGMLIRWTADS